MTLRKIFVLAAIACLVAAAAYAQPLSTGAGEAGSASFTEPEGGSMVLYDQTDSAGGNGAPDQDFEAGFDAYDSEGADDFDVTWPDGWDIEQVNTIGTTGTPGGATVDVNFYTDNGGTPLGGTQVCTYAAVTPTIDNLGSLTVDLPMPCELDSGLNWVAIQVNQNFGSFGQHFWSNRSVQSFAPSKWRNPGGGFATGCVDWANQAGTQDGNPATGCGVGGGTNPDFLFSLVGVLGVPSETDIGISKNGPGTAVDTVTYTIAVTNNGPVDATNVVVDDDLPGTYVSDACDTGTTNMADPWQWTIGNLAVGNTASCDVTVDITGLPLGSDISNTATVTADQTNTNPDGGTSNTVVTTVGTPLDIPTLGQIGLVAMLVSLLGAGLYRLRRRK
jgi:uncharacterized repeat protein (TIGR01451 family)